VPSKIASMQMHRHKSMASQSSSTSLEPAYADAQNDPKPSSSWPLKDLVSSERLDNTNEMFAIRPGLFDGLCYLPNPKSFSYRLPLRHANAYQRTVQPFQEVRNTTILACKSAVAVRRAAKASPGFFRSDLPNGRL
jgi:hypothetical protein